MGLFLGRSPVPLIQMCVFEHRSALVASISCFDTLVLSEVWEGYTSLFLLELLGQLGFSGGSIYISGSIFF